jgi:hypothetical protein
MVILIFPMFSVCFVLVGSFLLHFYYTAENDFFLKFTLKNADIIVLITNCNNDDVKECF